MRTRIAVLCWLGLPSLAMATLQDLPKQWQPQNDAFIAATWEMMCFDEKKTLSAIGDAAYLTLSERKSPPQRVDEVWMLNIDSYKIPIPAIDYLDVTLVKGDDLTAPMIILSDDLRGINITISRDQLASFTKKHERNDIEQLLDRLADQKYRAQKRRPVDTESAADMLAFALNHTPEDVACTPKNWAKEWKIQMSLSAKLLLPNLGDKQWVYPIPNAKYGWIVESPLPGAHSWGVSVPRKNHSNQFYTFNYKIGGGSKYQYIGAYVGTGQVPVKPQPAWLKHLERLLNAGRFTPSRELETALRKAGYRKDAKDWGISYYRD